MTACPAPGTVASADGRRAPHWHAGWNVPGCLPEADPGTYDSFEDARAALAEDMERHADGESTWVCEHPCGGEPWETCGESCGSTQAERITAARGDLLRSHGPSWSASAVGLVYWVEPCPGCEAGDEGAPPLEATVSA